MGLPIVWLAACSSDITLTGKHHDTHATSGGSTQNTPNTNSSGSPTGDSGQTPPDSGASDPTTTGIPSDRPYAYVLVEGFAAALDNSFADIEFAKPHEWEGTTSTATPPVLDLCYDPETEYTSPETSGPGTELFPGHGEVTVDGTSFPATTYAGFTYTSGTEVGVLINADAHFPGAEVPELMTLTDLPEDLTHTYEPDGSVDLTWTPGTDGNTVELELFSPDALANCWLTDDGSFTIDPDTMARPSATTGTTSRSLGSTPSRSRSCRTPS